MSETRFLEALDAPSAERRFDLLPDSSRAAYEDLFQACDDARFETSDSESLLRLEARVEAGALSTAPVRRGARLLWLSAAAAAALILALPMILDRNAANESRVALDGQEEEWPKEEEPSPSPEETPEASDPEEEPERVEEEAIPEKKLPIRELPGKPRFPRHEEELVEETPIDPKKKDGVKYARQPGSVRLAVRKVARDLGDRLDALRALPKTAVVVLQGEFDDGAGVLAAYKIPHTVVDRNKLVAYDLGKARILVLCCGRNPFPRQKPALLKKLRAFTEAHGWILSSDWALSPYVTELFAAQVKLVEPRTRQPDVTLSVTMTAKATSSPLLAGVFGQQKQQEWWFEEAGKFFKPQNGARLLVSSAVLNERFGTPAVVLTFQTPFARGSVVHTQAHLFQKPDRASTDAIAGMHRLYLNTILEATK